MAKPRLTFPVILRKGHEWLGVGGTVTLGLIALSCPFIAHKGGGSVGSTLKMIHYGEFLPATYRWIWIDSQGLLMGLLVLSGWLMHRRAVKRAAATADKKAREEVLASLKQQGITVPAIGKAYAPEV